MRVQPNWPMRPFAAMTMRARELAVVTCSAASMPAPPAPRMRTSAVRSSMGSMAQSKRVNVILGDEVFNAAHINQVLISDECINAPISDDDADEHDGDRDRC